MCEEDFLGPTPPGFQHLVHNLLQDVHQTLSGWDYIYQGLTTISKLLCSPDRKERFIWSCMDKTVHGPKINEVRAFSCQLYEARWGCVLEFMLRLQPLLPTLSSAWNHTKYMQHGDLPSKDRTTAFDPQSLTTYLSSGFFHLYIELCIALEKLPPQIIAYAEGCPCHQPLLPFLSAEQRERMMERHYLGARRSCPAQGMTMPELVAGKLDEFLKRCTANLVQEIVTIPLPHHVLPVTETQMQTLVSDCEQGKATLLGILKLKTNFVRKLPWLLIGLAVRDPLAVKAIAQQALAEFDAHPQETQHDPLTWSMLNPTASFRKDVQKLAVGGTFAELSLEGRRRIASFRFIYAVELQT